ncbi:hypothetical protein KOW79_000319 [Hemibagrus wyckioides]|uniref:Secreted protein n=1 Tax=Hemibagrus wyckioides TaxID=337641 RepID=A0A9D3P7T1_9TELE|nr:hypothetical protein KOW79_000319 [Hemibagrus wyckioides]
MVRANHVLALSTLIKCSLLCTFAKSPHTPHKTEVSKPETSNTCRLISHFGFEPHSPSKLNFFKIVLSIAELQKCPTTVAVFGPPRYRVLQQISMPLTGLRLIIKTTTYMTTLII